jgi:hypothetical protein
MQFKKLILSFTAIALAITLSACGSSEQGATDTTAATTKAATTTAAQAEDTEETFTTPEGFTGDRIFPTVSFQDYTDEKLVEYIDLTADFQAYTPGMIEMNDAIFEDVYSRISRYEELYAESENNTAYYIGGINVWAYSITDENFIQIYNTILEYPTYGTAGDLVGYVSDIENDDYVTLDEFMESIGTTADDVIYEITESYARSNPTDTVGAVYLKTYNLMQGPDGEYSYGYMFEMETTKTADGDPNKNFYMYTPDDGDVWEMNSEQLFDPYGVDQYDPPLHCQEGWWDYYEENYVNAEDGQGDVIPADETYGILQGDYYYRGDTSAAHFTFYGTENVDAYYGSGSYETSYTLQALPDEEINDDGYTYNRVSFDVFNADGEYVFMFQLIDDAPGSFEVYDKDGYFVAEYVNVNA